MITPQNVQFHELIGLDVRVVHASNQSLIGITGFIIDETRNMVTIRTCCGPKNVQKRRTVFRLQLPSGKIVDLEGSALIMAPEKRINMRIRT